MWAYVVILLINCFGSVIPELIPHQTQQYYDLVNKVSLGDFQQSSKDELSYLFRSQLKINSVWHSEKDQLLQLYFESSTISGKSKKNEKYAQEDISKIPDRPFYISLINGIPKNVIAHTSRDQSLLNLERAIASLLHLRYESGPISEVDVSGYCTAFYNVKSSTKVEKTKTECSHWDLKVQSRMEKALGVNQYSRGEIHFDLNAEGYLVRAKSEEIHQIKLEANKDYGTQVKAEISLEHLAKETEDVKQWKFSSIKEAIDSILDWYRVFDLEADVDGSISEIKEITLKQKIVEYSKQLDSDQIGTYELATKFAELIPLARITKQPEFIEILHDKVNIIKQVVDMLGAVQTMDAHNAINVVIDLKKDSDLYERYLQSLAVGVHPDRAIMEDLLKQLEEKEMNGKLKDSILQTLCSLIQRSGLDPNDDLLQKTRAFIMDQFEQICQDEDCRTVYLRALQNLRDPSTIPFLMKLVSNDYVKISRIAMQALHSFAIVNFNENHRTFLMQIFYQTKRKFDSSVRLMALDILLEMKPTRQQIIELLLFLSSNDRQYEIKTYVLQKLRMLADRCIKFKSLFESCLFELPMVNNYNVMAQKGLSTVLARALSQKPAFNESLLSVQEIYKGILKRGSVELNLNVDDEKTSLFKLVLYTGGLTSFGGDTNVEDEDDTEDSQTTAGMEIYVQNVLLRPIVFFTSQSELMGHVWSGTASELTPAYQATTVTFDHENYIILSSGATLYINIIAANSIDLNGKVDLSIWNRNANTEINQNTGTSIVGQVRVGFTYGQLANEFSITFEPKLKLQANLDFYSDIKLCMQLERPELSLRYDSMRSLIFKNKRNSVRTILKHSIPGKTLALNEKNNEMCNILLS